MSVLCCQVEVSATSWSLVQRSPTDLRWVVVCDLETSKMRRPWPTGGGGCRVKKKNKSPNSVSVSAFKDSRFRSVLYFSQQLSYWNKQDTQCTYNVTVRGVCATVDVVGKQWVLHIACACVPLAIQHAARMRHTVICTTLQYFSTLSHKRHDFRKKKKLSNTKCVFWFPLQILSETFLILRRNERDIIKYV